MFDLKTFQHELEARAERNIPRSATYQSLIGVFQEIGKLTRMQIEDEGISDVPENRQAAKRQAIGDVIIYMARYCTAQGWSLAEIIYEAWQKTKRGLRPET